jgi:hypothetical protein
MKKTKKYIAVLSIPIGKVQIFSLTANNIHKKLSMEDITSRNSTKDTRKSPNEKSMLSPIIYV